MIYRLKSPLPRLIPLFTILFLLSVFSSPASANAPAEKVLWPILSTIHKRQKSVNTASVKKRKPRKFINKTDYSKRRPIVSAATLTKRISARSAIIMDADTGKSLYSRAATRPGQPASTIKILTGLIAIQELKSKEMIPISRKASRMPRSKVYLATNKTYRANDLINAVLVASANDASVALAEKLAGSEKAFAVKMTKKARELGARRTVCKTASGLTARGQQTTARDLAVIFNNAMKNKEFSRRIKRTTMNAISDKGKLRNHNKALWKINGAQGGKTGYTYAARQTYVGKFKRGDDEIVVAILGSTTMWKDIEKLVEYGFTLKNNKHQNTAQKKSSASDKLTRNEQAPAASKKIAQL